MRRSLLNSSHVDRSQRPRPTLRRSRLPAVLGLAALVTAAPSSLWACMAGGGTATGGATAGGTAVAAGTATALATGGAAAFRLGGTGGVVNAGSFRGSSISPFALQTPTMSFPTQGAYNQMLLQQQYQIQQRILAERAADARRAALRQHRAQLAAARAERLAKEAELKATGKKPAKTGSTAARSRVQPVDRPEADDAVAPTTSATAVQSPRPTTTARL